MRTNEHNPGLGYKNSHATATTTATACTNDAETVLPTTTATAERYYIVCGCSCLVLLMYRAVKDEAYGQQWGYFIGPTSVDFSAEQEMILLLLPVRWVIISAKFNSSQLRKNNSYTINCPQAALINFSIKNVITER
jgi:hypothetical protein